MSYRMGVAVLLLAMLSPACTFVQVNQDGEGVQLITAAEGESCKRLGKTTVSTLARIAGMPRHEESIRDELVTLARNSAAEMKGDAIAPLGVVKEGELTFAVYRCRVE